MPLSPSFAPGPCHGASQPPGDVVGYLCTSQSTRDTSQALCMYKKQPDCDSATSYITYTCKAFVSTLVTHASSNGGLGSELWMNVVIAESSRLPRVPHSRGRSRPVAISRMRHPRLQMSLLRPHNLHSFLWNSGGSYFAVDQSHHSDTMISKVLPPMDSAMHSLKAGNASSLTCPKPFENVGAGASLSPNLGQRHRGPHITQADKGVCP